jgi:hypothetical protein
MATFSNGDIADAALQARALLASDSSDVSPQNHRASRSYRHCQPQEMHQTRFAGGGGTGDQRNFADAHLKLDPNQDRGCVVAGMHLRQAGENAALEQVQINAVRTDHDWTSRVESMHRGQSPGLLNVLLP